MTWFKTCDGFHSHPKTQALFEGPCPGDAIALFMLAGSWCAHELTDGAVPLGFVRRSGLNPNAAAELVRVRLFEEVGDGSFRMHDYLKYNPSREQVLRANEKNAARQAKWRASHPVIDGASVQGSNAVTVSAPDPDPVKKISSEGIEKDLGSADATSRERAREEQDSGQILKLKPPSIDHWRDAQLQMAIRVEFQKRYEVATASMPNQAALGKLSATLAPWLESTGTLRGVRPLELLQELLGGFFANDNARLKGYPAGFLAQNPLEYLEQPKTKQQQIEAAERACAEAELQFRRLRSMGLEATPGGVEAKQKWRDVSNDLRVLKGGERWTASA